MASTPPSPAFSATAPHEYAGIVEAIYQRTLSRDSPTQEESFEHDLRLSAQVGQALLEERNTLERKVAQVDLANQKLLDRLTRSVKENVQLQRKLEQAVGNLEQADFSNRALLNTLEEDRKTISRLSLASAQFVATSTQLKVLTQKSDDTLQELAATQKRASTAESRMKKQSERVIEMEERLEKAIKDLEEMRQDKVLRSRKSKDALTMAKAKFTRSNGEGLGISLDNSEELMKLFESLMVENDSLRTTSAELSDLLDVSREEQSRLRSEMENRQACVETDEDDIAGTQSRPRTKALRPLSSEILMSPPLSNFGRSPSPASPQISSFARSWAPSSNLGHAPRASTSSSTNGDGYPILGTKRRSLANGSGIVPIGVRTHSRRASVDVNGLGRRRSNGTGSAPVSPMMGDTFSPISSDAEEFARPARRHPRPLSLTLGPSLFPLLPDGRLRSPSLGPRVSRRSHSPIDIPFATTEESPTQVGPSGLSLSSPEKRRKDRSLTPEPTVVTVEFSTQTSPRPLSIPPFSPETSTPIRSVPQRHNPPLPSVSHSAASVSDISDRERALLDFGLPAGSFDLRTAALGALIEHIGKLLGRIQSADISSQEKRWKKQHISGDVKFLIGSNVKDLLSDVEGLRNHFRRLLEQERSSAAKDTSGSSSHHTDTESLVVRRDFVALVKLFRDLLFETTRLRSLVNRVQLDPSLAHNLRTLDAVTAEGGEMLKTAAPAAAGLLAPLSRLFGSALLGVADSAETTAPRAPASSRTTPAIRPIGKLSGSSGVSSATVSVEFNSGVAGRVVAVGGAGVSSPKVASPREGVANAGVNKSGTQVRRDLNSIFAGGLSSTSTHSPTDTRVVGPPPPPPPSTRHFSSNPFGRLLASYRPALSSTTNAVLDSIPHAPQTTAYEPPLLERTLRARGLSDSSIRSTFVAHANPHHRILTPATLALSSERSNEAAVAITIRNEEDAVRKGLEDISFGKSLSVGSGSVGRSVSRKSSMAVLRRKPSGANLKPAKLEIDAVPPVPSLPISISPSTPHILIAPSRSITPIPHSNPATLQATSHLGVQASTTLFGSLSSWVTSPLAIAVATESTSPGASNAFKAREAESTT